MEKIIQENNAVKKRKKLKKSNVIFAVISSVILGAISLFYIVLLCWALISSFKSNLDFGYNPIGFPQAESWAGWHFENYYVAYRVLTVGVTYAERTVTVYAHEMLLNSVIYSVGCAISAVFWTALVAYCCSRFDYKICNVLYAVVIVVMMLPIIGALPSEVQMAKTLGLYDSLFGMFIMRAGFVNMNFLVFYGAFKGIPKTYTEAAIIDGCGQWRVFFQIILPLVKSSLLAVGLLQFIMYWNDYSIPMIYLPHHPVLSFGLHQFQESRSQHATEPIKLAATFICCAPVLVIFLIFRDKLMSNISFGGLKG
ncbi:MAG: carbohydrate ABC transporter permease [Clostridia bacterium]|nr:carbohydrate ABC transporter permease [Clostridia bacterium]